MRVLAVLPLIALFGCAHHQAETKAEASNPPPAPPPQTPTAANPPAQTAAPEEDCTSVRVHFDFDRSDVGAADRDGLERAARCLSSNPKLHIAIEGNADERGTQEYNLALGDRRAHSVAQYLRSLGASNQQLQTVSYGKEHPLCSEHDEQCWAQNRRADVVANNTKKPHRK
jgi:peptidoglycan-associated lipoprotein